MMVPKFNQDASCVAVWDSETTRIYQCDPMGMRYEGPGAYAVAMLFSTSLVAHVDIAQRAVTIVNTKKHATICELAFDVRVVRVAMNRRRVVVELEDRLEVYDVSNMMLLHTIRVGGGNIALASNDASLLAFQHTAGHVTLFDCIGLKPLHHLHPHSGPIRTMAFSTTGSLLATASERGTVVKVYDLTRFELAHELRRGSTPATITSMALDDDLCIVASSHGTVHFFSLTKGPTRGRRGSLRLPSTLQSYLTPVRNFATVQVPQDIPASVAIASDVCYLATAHNLTRVAKTGQVLSSGPYT